MREGAIPTPDIQDSFAFNIQPQVTSYETVKLQRATESRNSDIILRVVPQEQFVTGRARMRKVMKRLHEIPVACVERNSLSICVTVIRHYRKYAGQRIPCQVPGGAEPHHRKQF